MAYDSWVRARSSLVQLWRYHEGEKERREESLSERERGDEKESK